MVRQTDPRPLCYLTGYALCGLFLLAAGCAAERPESPPARPEIAAGEPESADKLPLDSAPIAPMYRELLPIDLPNVVEVAMAQNVDIRQARERVVAARGLYESSIEGMVPSVSPSIGVTRLTGVNTSVVGVLTPANFTILGTAALIKFALNPGQAYYEVIASKKRLLGTEQQERFVVLNTLQRSTTQYYDLVLAQVRVAVARDAVTEAEELLRLTSLRLKTGTGILADDDRARAALAARQQELTLAIDAFYEGGLALAVTLNLDPTVTLIPKPNEIETIALIRDDVPIEDRLDLAVTWRPDLQSVRDFAEAAGAAASSVVWGGVGPQLQAGYQNGVLRSQTPDNTSGRPEQQIASASVGFSLSLSILGRIKTADAVKRQAVLEAERTLIAVRAEVVRTSQRNSTQAQLIPLAKQEVEAATEALRLARENLKAGNALVDDVLLAEDALNTARQHYTGAVVSYDEAQVNLLAALGILDKTRLLSRNQASTFEKRLSGEERTALRAFQSARARSPVAIGQMMPAATK
jgi:outer membrane protein TolC